MLTIRRSFVLDVCILLRYYKIPVNFSVAGKFFILVICIRKNNKYDNADQ